MAKKIAIIGGGISGLAAAWFAHRKFGDQIDLGLYEKDKRLGGTIGTTRERDFLIDWGSNGFLDREPLTLEFIEDIGLSEKLYRSDDKSTKRFIYRKGRLWEIRPNPVQFMKSGLLSLKGRLRLAGEVMVPRKKDDKDESIFDFAARRIGKEAAATMIDPMVSGIYGGDARALSLRACFPVMEEMEQDYGGLIKAMIAKQKEARKKKKEGGGPAGPSGHLTSFRGGLYTLIEHLGDKLKDYVHLEASLKKVSKRENGGFHLQFADREETCDILILAIPTYHAAEMIRGINVDLSGHLASIPYSSLAVVAQGFKISQVERPLDGFGFLVPHSEGLNILGSIWTSVIFPEQAPSGYALFRTMLGGALNEEIVEKPAPEISAMAYNDLKPILGFTGKPEIEKTFIWDRAIPQYVMGHPRRLEEINGLLDGIPGLHLTGNAYNGVGLNDCIKLSKKVVESISI